MNNIKLPKTLKKLSLYARSKGNAANIEWRVLGNPDSWHGLAPDLVRFDWVHDVRTVTQIGLQVLSRTDHDSAVIIERIEIDGEPLSDLDHFGIYQLRSGGIKRTYGYMDEPGQYRFKIRFDAVVHNFVLYSLPQMQYQR